MSGEQEKNEGQEAEAAQESPESAGETAVEASGAAEETPQVTFEGLKRKTVAELRVLAKGLEHDALHGYSTMHKEQLLVALCTALGVEAHEHHVVVGVDKGAVKAKIRELRSQRDAALEARDRQQLRRVRNRIRRLKRKLRKAMV